MDVLPQTIKCINGIKGFAAFVIAFCVHYQVVCPQFFPLKEWLPFFSLRGHFFVEMFFMLSGFLLSLAYGGKIASHNISFMSFMYKRISKWYFLYAISTIVCGIFEFLYIHSTGHQIFERYTKENISYFILNLLLVQSGLIGHEEGFNAPGWFLSVLVVCYAMFWVSHWYLKATNAYVVHAGGAIVAVMTLWNNWNYPVLNSFMARGILSFFIGMLIYKLYCHKSARLKEHSGFLSLVIFILCYICFKYNHSVPIGNYILCYGIIVMPALLIAVLFFKPLNRLFSTKLMYLIGSISAELFLLHYTILYGLKTFDVCLSLGCNFHSRKIFISYFILCIAICVLYKILERYVNRSGEKIKNYYYRNVLKSNS